MCLLFIIVGVDGVLPSSHAPLLLCAAPSFANTMVGMFGISILIDLLNVQNRRVRVSVALYYELKREFFCPSVETNPILIQPFLFFLSVQLSNCSHFPTISGGHS